MLNLTDSLVFFLALVMLLHGRNAQLKKHICILIDISNISILLSSKSAGPELACRSIPKS